MKADGPRLFWDQLAVELDCDHTVRGAMLITADIDRFIGYLPEDRQRLARELLTDVRLRNGKSDSLPPTAPLGTIRTTGHDDSDVIWLHYQGPVETFATGFHAGKIDQKHYYLDPDSANAWGSLVRAEAYPTYDHCKKGLQSLFDSEPWTQLVRNSRPTGAVMLAGGGAPTKDLLLMRSLLAQPDGTDSIYYYLLDISFYMLNESRLWIREHSRNVDGFERIKLRFVYHDTLKMTNRDRELFHKDGNVVFAITGGTIGNFSEAAFFRSLNRAAEDGDLLIVSADTIDDVPSDDVVKGLTHKYDNPDLRRFIEPVVRAVVSKSSVQDSVSSALNRIKVTLRPGSETNASDVPSSWSVNVKLNIDRRDLTLVTSTRYESSELVNYAARFGWEAVCQIGSPLNPHYKQFLFRRKAQETGGIQLVP
jgi:hypothetical protein